MTTPEAVTPDPALQEAARQLEAAVHDAQVAFDCIGLGNVDRAHTSAITARAAIDAATVAIQTALAQVYQAPPAPTEPTAPQVPPPVIQDPPTDPGPQTPLR